MGPLSVEVTVPFFLHDHPFIPFFNGHVFYFLLLLLFLLLLVFSSSQVEGSEK